MNKQMKDQKKKAGRVEKNRLAKAAKAPKSRKEFGQAFGSLEERLREVARMGMTLYQNQQKLGKAIDALAGASDQLDTQFSVLSRLCILKLNSVLGDDKKITHEFVTSLFHEWVKLKERSDFRDHNRAWFLGEDLSNLPPEPKKEEQPTAPADQSAPQAKADDVNQYPEGAEIFGGDYNAKNSTVGNQVLAQEPPSNDVAREKDPVPQVSPSDTAKG